MKEIVIKLFFDTRIEWTWDSLISNIYAKTVIWIQVWNWHQLQTGRTSKVEPAPAVLRIQIRGICCRPDLDPDCEKALTRIRFL